MRYLVACLLLTSIGCAATTTTSSSSLSAGDQLLTIDHYVRVRSTAPSMNGQTAQIYVRERVESRNIQRGSSGVVLFVHGAGTPAEVAFDVPSGDYSWMAYLARAGFDVFSMDMTGYGRSTRPTVMNDPCNLTREQQAAFIPSLLAAPCAPTFTQGADDDCIGLERPRRRRRVHPNAPARRPRKHGGLVAWGSASRWLCGAACRQSAEARIIGPGLQPDGARESTCSAPDGTAMNTQSRQELTALWNRQVGCPGQYDQVVFDSVWSSMLESDPVGATWGPGVRRAPQTTTWGWNAGMVAKTQAPTLMVAGVHDKQVLPARVNELYADIGSREKVFVDLACSSHNAMWEKNHLLLFRASVEWLAQGTVNGAKQGMLRLGYDTNERPVD